MTSPVNNFQDILNAMERDPTLRDALRRHILHRRSPTSPRAARKNRGRRRGSQIRRRQNGGDISRLRGTDYESHVATYVHRFLRRSLGINASVFSTQRDKSALTGLLDEAEKKESSRPKRRTNWTKQT